MKKRILSLALALLLCVGLMPSALALEYTPFGMHEFREGLMPVLVGNPEEQQTWNYINEDEELVDLNKGRFLYCFDFYEGLAAVIDHDFRVGYINTTGKLVIPCQYGAYDETGSMWIGHFKNGTATVLRQSVSAEMVFSEFGFPMYFPGTWEVGKIDKKGNLVESFTAKDMGDSIYEKGLYMLSDAGMLSDGYTFEPEPEPEPKPEPEETRYQSTAELTSAFVVDMDNNGFRITITNPTENHDSGTVAMVATSSTAIVSFIDYDLEPYESKVYTIGATGLVGNPNPGFLLLNGWGDIFNSYMIHFTSDEEMAAFRNGIPQEADNADHYSAIISNNNGQGTLVVCYGRNGDNWLAKYGMSRFESPYIYPDDPHNCTAR